MRWEIYREPKEVDSDCQSGFIQGVTYGYFGFRFGFVGFRFMRFRYDGMPVRKLALGIIGIYWGKYFELECV